MEEMARLYLEEQISLKELGKRYNLSAASIRNRLIKHGVTIRSYKEAHKAKYPEGRFAELSGHWNGGKRPFKGYMQILVQDHPAASKQGYVMEHRLVAEIKLGRRLKSTEIVHHIDLDKLNNNPDNLFLCRDNSHHRQIHAQLERTATELIRNGSMVFKDGAYTSFS